MSKRDYKSYNILEEELGKNSISDNNVYEEVQEVNIELMSKDENNTEDTWNAYTVDENQEVVDMTFSGYKNYYQTKERSTLVKWGLRMVKLILILMLLPLLTIIAGTIVLFMGGFLTSIILPIGLGVMILGITCFISTQIKTSLIALGITISITSISLGGILLILFCMLIKGSIHLLKKYKKPHRERMKKEGR